MGTDSEVLVQKQLIRFKWRLIHALKQEPHNPNWVIQVLTNNTPKAFLA